MTDPYKPIRDFAQGIKDQRDTAEMLHGVAGATVENARATVARELLILLDGLQAQQPGADLSATLQRYVAGWVERSAPRIRDEMALAKLEIVLSQPQGEDDGTLYLDYSIDETVTADRSGARVVGHRFDPEPRS